MYRNLSKKIEVIWEVLDICLRDQRQAWVLGEDGKYSQLQPAGGGERPETRGTHETLMELARGRSE